MAIYLIWAQDSNNGIGKNNTLPWNIPNEMKHFRETTLNKTIVMGRKTLESIGRALPKRKNIVLTTNANYVFPNVIIENDINNILSMKEDIYVIGGKQIYESFMPYADFLIVSVIEHKYDCDTFMKPIDNNKFNLKKEVINDGFKIQYWEKK